MSNMPSYVPAEHDIHDPDPWLALYTDQSTPIDPKVKAAWLANLQSRSRQFLMPFARPLGQGLVVLLQVIKVFVPNRFTSSAALHRLLAWALATWVKPEANWLILRHFHIGTENLSFIAQNAGGVELPSHPLRPRTLNELKPNAFVQHDINLFNFVIHLNRALEEKQAWLKAVDSPDFSMITDGDFDIEELPRRWTNFVDLESAIELFTPIYQLFLTDNDFWRAVNSLQLDETVGLYAATILGRPDQLILVNNKHPLVPLSTRKGGHRLVLHGLSSEMLHALLVRARRADGRYKNGFNGTS